MTPLLEGGIKEAVTSRFTQETVEKLQETLRGLQLEFEAQKQSRKDLEQLAKGLQTELTILR